MNQTIPNPMYIVSFDQSKKAREEKTIYSDVEKRLLKAASLNGMMVDMGNEGKMFNYMFSDMNKASHFYNLLLDESAYFDADAFEFNKYELNRGDLTQKEQAFLDARDPRVNPELIGKN